MKYILIAAPDADEWVDFDSGKECVNYLHDNDIETAVVLLMDEGVIDRQYVYHDKKLWTKLPREPEKHLSAWVQWP
jgi:hypothetical protein